MLSMQVSLGAVWARKLPVGVFLRNLSLRRACSGGGRGRASRSTGKHSASALRAYHVSRLLAIRGEHRGLRHERALSVRRVHAGLGHLTSSRHGPQNWRHTAAGGWRRRNWLRMGSRSRSLRHHGRSGRILLLLLLIRVVGHHLITTAAGVLAGGRRRVRRHVVGNTWSVRGRGSSRAVLVATVRVLLLHTRVARLQRR